MVDALRSVKRKDDQRALGAEGPGEAGADPSAAALFALLWEGLADVLGTSSTAALVRRAVRGAMARSPELALLVIVREELEYRFTLPSAWNERGGPGPAALRELGHELRALLVELTGSVVLRHIARIPELRERGILALVEEEQP